MMRHSGACDLPDRDAVIQRYVAGTLEGGDSERFAEHYFACEVCWDEVRLGTAIRASSGGAERTAHEAPRRHTAVWLPLAAAASLAAIAFLAWEFEPTQGVDVTPVYRGETAPIDVTIDRSGDDVRLQWRRVSDADRYAVAIYDDGGRELAVRESVAANAELSGAQLPGAAFVEVCAIGAEGEVLARSRMISIE